MPGQMPSHTKVKDQNTTVSLSQSMKPLTPAVTVEPIVSTTALDDLLSDLKGLNEAYACNMDIDKGIVVKTSTTEAHSLSNQPPNTSLATLDMSTLHSFGKGIIADIPSKPLMTLATNQVLKSQFAEIIQTFLNTPEPEAIKQLLARLQKVHSDLDVKFSESQTAILSHQQTTETLSELKQETTSLESVKNTLATHISKAKDRAKELSDEIQDLEQLLADRKEKKNNLDEALAKNESQFMKASGMFESNKNSLLSLEGKMSSLQQAARDAKDFQDALAMEISYLRTCFQK
ncbi:hypothetical protein PIB30_053860 [Stylosanthes scabra]|uniref:Uncharacterized protein n=1 Tax=Stylosanthes scabra TaxID=79078 RepID=A0ABU6ZHC5_9FABA|nr:hypothetical protein [Stylosanthes scabra]